MIRKIFSLYLIFVFTKAEAATYYISNSGNELNDGITPSTPWQTINKLNSMMSQLKPGDNILFERGSVFTGQINITANGNQELPIVFGAYGKGRNPVISGSEHITNWSLYKNKIYKANVNFKAANLFSNNKQMIIARYPNTGFLKIMKPFKDPKAGFNDATLTNPNGYWNDCNVRIRTVNWAYENTKVKDFTSGSFTFTLSTEYPTLSGWGYYLDNKLEELDAESEWYYDAIKKIVYFFATGGTDPNSLTVEVSVYDFGFYSQQAVANIIFQELDIKNQSHSGISLAGGSSNIQMNNCTFSGQIEAGVRLFNSSGCIINNCRFFSINGIAVDMLTVNNILISNNILKNIGMIPGYENTGGAFPMCGMVLLGIDSSQVRNNYLDSIGHDGINCLGISNIVEKNIINNILLLLNDGGAIKCYGVTSSNSIWRNNFIYNVPGNIESTDRNYNIIIAEGIYLDYQSNNMLVDNNTIIRCGRTGIGISNGISNFVNNNLCYDNYSGINFYQTSLASKDNNITNNIFFGTSEDQYAVILQSDFDNFIMGKFDSNYYYNTYENFFQYEINLMQRNMDFSQWNLFGNNFLDKNSANVSGSSALYPKIYRNMSNESTSILLNEKYKHRDLNQKNINGSITLQPWSSTILLTDKDLSKLPEVTVAGGPLNFGKIIAGNESFPYWYLLNAENVNAPIIIKAPIGFSVSTDYNGEYSDILRLNTTNGNVSKVIYVKFSPDADVNYNGLISNESESFKTGVKVLGKGN